MACTRRVRGEHAVTAAGAGGAFWPAVATRSGRAKGLGTATLTVRLSVEARRAVEEQAAAEGVSTSEYVRRILEGIAPRGRGGAAASAGPGAARRDPAEDGEEPPPHVHQWRKLDPRDPREARAMGQGWVKVCEACEEVEW